MEIESGPIIIARARARRQLCAGSTRARQMTATRVMSAAPHLKRQLFYSRLCKHFAQTEEGGYDCCRIPNSHCIYGHLILNNIRV